MKWRNPLRPIEWGALSYSVLVYSWTGYPLDAALFFSRAAGILAALLLVVVARELWSYSRRPYHSDAPRPLLHISLAVAFAPWVFALVAASQSETARVVASSPPRDIITGTMILFLSAALFGLPLVLLWLLWAPQVREHGAATLSLTRSRLRDALSVFRDWAPLLLIISGYGVGSEPPSRDFDAEMLAIDRVLFAGHDPQDLLASIISVPLSEVLAAVYAFYAVLYPLVLCTIFAVAGRAALQRAAFTLGFALLVAYLGYALLPVKGPLLSRAFDQPLDLYLVGPVKEALMDKARWTWDCFPSMHTCGTVLLAEAAWRYARRLFWFISPAVVLMPLACVYLRYHYVADIIAGLALAAAMIALTRWHFAKRPTGYV